MERLAFQINAFLLSFENPGGFFFYIYIVSFHKKKLGSTTAFNIDSNKKCFLNAKSAYSNDFWNSEHVYMHISKLITHKYQLIKITSFHSVHAHQ